MNSNVNIKVIVVGPAGSGKSTLIQKYTARNFDLKTHTVPPTLGMDLSTKILKDFRITAENIGAIEDCTRSANEVGTSTQGAVVIPKLKVLLLDLSGAIPYRDAVRKAYEPLSATDQESNSMSVLCAGGDVTPAGITSSKKPTASVTKIAVAIVIDLAAVAAIYPISGESIGTHLSTIIDYWANDIAVTSKGTASPSVAQFTIIGTKADLLFDHCTVSGSKCKLVLDTLETVSQKYSFPVYVTSSVSDDVRPMFANSAIDVFEGIIRHSLVKHQLPLTLTSSTLIKERTSWHAFRLSTIVGITAVTAAIVTILWYQRRK